MSVPSIADHSPYSAPWLFAETEAAARAAFAKSIDGSLAPDEALIDLFCGAGGWFGRGEEGELDSLGLRVDAAVNHSPLAIEWHEKNHPECVHLIGDAWTTRPREVLAALSEARGRAMRMGWLIASAACTTHSRARGSAPISKRIHMLGWCCARYIKDGMPRGFTLENVVEWQDWGPVSRKTGKPDPARKGQHYRKLLAYLRGLGYTVESRIIEAADHGTHCRRRRLFIQGRKDNGPIFWPEETHGVLCRKGREQKVVGREQERGAVRSTVHTPGSVRDLRHGKCEVPAAPQRLGRNGTPSHTGRVPHRPAYEVIDWSDLGHSIFLSAEEGKAARCKRPLAPKSLQRIAKGVIRHVLHDPSPFIMRITQTGVASVGGSWPVSGPTPTQTTREDLAVISPVMTPCGGPSREPSRVDKSMHTVLTREDRALCTPILASVGGAGYAGKLVRLDRPMGTVMREDRRAVVTPVIVKYFGGVVGHRVDGLLGTPTTAGDGHSALISPLLAKVGYGERAGQAPRHQSVRSPLLTIPAGGVKQGIVTPVMLTLRNNDTGSRPDEPFDTVSAGGNHAALILPFLTQYYSQGESTRADVAIPTVVTKDRHALVTVIIDGETFVMVDILFRMLRPHELAAAMGFAKSYRFPAAKRSAVQLIGNAVSPKVGERLILSALPGGRRVA